MRVKHVEVFRRMMKAEFRVQIAGVNNVAAIFYPAVAAISDVFHYLVGIFECFKYQLTVAKNSRAVEISRFKCSRAARLSVGITIIARALAV